MGLMSENAKKEPRRVSGESSWDVKSNYMFCPTLCRNCNYFFEDESNWPYHCKATSSDAISHRSKAEGFKQYDDCKYSKKEKIKDNSGGKKYLLLFVIAIGVVIYGFLKYPTVMFQKYWFFGALGIGLTLSILIRRLLLGNPLLSTYTYSEKKEKLSVFLNRFTGICIFVAYFLYNNGLEKIASNKATIIIWLILLVVLIQGVKILNILFLTYSFIYPIAIIVLITMIGSAVLFGVLNYILGIFFMVFSPKEKGYLEESRSTGVRK